MAGGLSILMPVFNERATIEAAIEDALTAELPVPRRELIVVDDGSTDSTLAIVKGFAAHDPRVGYDALQHLAYAETLATGRAVYFAWNGAGRVDGQPLRLFTTVFLDRAEHATFTADRQTDLLRFGLPDLRGMTMARPEHAVAAE